MAATKVLILLGSRSDLPITEAGLENLKKASVGFALHIASAHRSPAYVDKLVKDFDRQGGEVLICVAGMSAHLAGVVAALTTKPVLAVPVSRQATAGLDALLSMSQMPGGIPVATMGFDKAGFTNASLFALQILAASNSKLANFLKDERGAMTDQVMTDDKNSSIIFNP